ncbi:MAG: hypothetical protein ACOX4D_09075 [Bacteroidales bacterium]|jgi:hypothetical protein
MKKINLLVAIIISLLLTSCTPTYIKVARQFVNNDNNLAVMVYPTEVEDIIYKYVNTQEIPGYDTMSVDNKLKSEISYSKFLKEISPNIVFDLFVNTYIETLSKTGLNVYTPEFAEEFNKNSNRTIVKLTQLQFDEYIEKKTDEALFFDSIIYYNDVFLNAFAISLWLDMRYPATSDAKILFASDKITDYHNGEFYYDFYSREILYEEDNMDMSPADIKYFIKKMAENYAYYTYDYLLTNYVKNNIVEDVDKLPEDRNLHLDQKTKFVYYYEDPEEWGFIELNE